MKKIILILLIFSSAIAAAMMFSWPEYGRFKELSVMKDQKQQELKDLEDYISHLQSISQQIKNEAPSLAKIDQALLGDNYIPNLFDFFQKSAFGTGVRLDGIKMGKTSAIKESKNIISREAILQITGPYSNLKNFANILEKNARIIDLTKMSLSTISNESASLIKTTKDVSPSLNLDIKVYSYQSQ